MSVHFMFHVLVTKFPSLIHASLFWQGYGGGDEVNMLQRHLLGTPTKFGVGANRATVASHLIKKYGYVDIRRSSWHEKQKLECTVQNSLDSEKIGVVVLDDAMQVIQLILSLTLLAYYLVIFFLTAVLKISIAQIEICYTSYIHSHFVEVAVLLCLLVTYMLGTGIIFLWHYICSKWCY